MAFHWNGAGRGEHKLDADDWTADFGIGIRELVYGLLAVARNFAPETEEEDGAVRMRVVDAPRSKPAPSKIATVIGEPLVMPTSSRT
jgi:hypothetical protein